MRKQPLLISLVSFIVGILLYDRFPVDSLYIYNALALSLITLGFAIFQFKNSEALR
ncbi:hypothetical protein [Chryseobacterium taklimakanense]|uniref:hypothetical protein n=1 Tax=Chryseobacterium taklimakanense TaxID=536441 RepID=UPI0013DD9390|nr:hypothetical protein [Chryseobacterium taklimakanense]